MQFESKELPGKVTHLVLTGRLDFYGAEAIEKDFTAAAAGSRALVVVDLSGVSFLSSIGIRLLIKSARAQTSRGGKLVLTAPQPLVRKVLETTGIDKVIPLLADVESARASIAE